MKLKRALLLFCCSLLPAWGGAVVIHQEKSLYRNILVYEERGLRCMKFGIHDSGRQSCISLTDPDTLVLNYTRLVLSALYLQPAPQNILIIGLGGGTMPGVLRKIYPDIPIDCVEIDQAVVNVAKTFFGFAPDPRIQVFVEDGRVFVKHALKRQRRYDLILLDAFDHISVPEHMTTREFLQEVKALLQPQGVLVANTFASGRLYDAESATYAAVFGEYFNVQSGNRVVLAKKDGLPADLAIRQGAERVEPHLRRFGAGKEWLLPLFAPPAPWPPETRILTDQYSPANLLNGRY
ncbi:MAG: fused MFS/spermidine synthase [Magnetococcales bacterium]|nr:fused MFS/spermidine synthase [Magnetococcales bacterium]